MECNQGKLRLFVKSQKVPSGLTEFSKPTMSLPWILSHSSIRAVVYEHVLDDSQRRLVAEAKRLSDSSGLDLEVVDLGKMGLIRRIFWSRIIGPSPTATSAGLVQIPSMSHPNGALS